MQLTAILSNRQYDAITYSKEAIEMDKQIGFIGLGIMGKPMALNLIKAGFDVTVYNRTASKAEQLVSQGSKKAGSPAEVAGGD